MSWNNVMPASAINIPASEYPPEGAFVAPKSTRGRKPSKWQVKGNHLVFNEDEQFAEHWEFASEAQAKAACAFARAFGYMALRYGVAAYFNTKKGEQAIED